MTNFYMRFLYEVVFEIFLSAIIYLSYTDFGKTTSSFVFTICIVCIIAVVLFLGLCFYLGFKKEPEDK